MEKGWEKGIVQEETFMMMEMFIFLFVVMVLRVYKYVKNYHIVDFVQFTIGQLYFNKAIKNKQITFATIHFLKGRNRRLNSLYYIIHISFCG